MTHDTTPKTNYDVIVVGGGASGMMAAASAGASGQKVLLLEKNKRLGEKLRITGGGRCNITNAEYNNKILLKNYGRAEQFLYSLFSQFSVRDTVRYFEDRGLSIDVEARKRAFPRSRKAEDVVHVLEKALQASIVQVMTDTTVKAVNTQHQHISSLSTNKGTFTAHRYIIATGSVSHPETGSTGDGFAWLETLGHTVSQPTPDIVPLRARDEWVTQLAGITLENVKITFYCEGEKQHSEKGNILCTHFGLSGPLILNTARDVADLLQRGLVTAAIDLFPAVDQGSLERDLVRVFDENKNKSLKNIIGEFAPIGSKRGVHQLLSTIVDTDTKVHSIRKDDRKKIAATLKAMPVEIEGLMGFEKAVVADGGMDLREIDFKTMKSRIVDNLYVTGDLLHINRPSGGFSLQLCWSSGFVAGVHATRGD